MSTVMDTLTGKSRSQSSSMWLWILAVSLVLFGLNTGYALLKTQRFGGASTSASSLQVNSQKLANLGREAINGDAAAFKAFKATKEQIVSDVTSLNDRFGDAADVSGPIKTVTSTWVPLGKSADQIIASEAAVLALSNNAKSFTDRVPQLQAQLDEVVRAM
jgi:twitching motility protein PilJ